MPTNVTINLTSMFAWGIVLLVIGFIFLIIIILIQCQIIPETTMPLYYDAWWWYLLDAVAGVMMLGGVYMICMSKTMVNASFASIKMSPKDASIE